MTISVIVPCYNREDILGRAIQSALAQTRAPDEIIVVDDGSHDSSANIARSFGDRVVVLEQANAGAAAARNHGIETAHGDWVAFLDSDDEWHPDKLAIQLAVAKRFPAAQLIFCDTLVRTDNDVLMSSRFALGGLYGAERELDADFALYDRSLFARMLTQSRVITSAVMVRRNLPELRFPEHIWGSEDWALWLNLALQYPFASVNRVLVTMHQQGDNISSRTGRLCRNDLLVLKDLARHLLLTPDERSLVKTQISTSRVGAVYHSLLSGEVSEARKLLNEVSPREYGIPAYIKHVACSYMPPRIVKRIAEYRLREASRTTRDTPTVV
ncbi:glycosyltransferase family 2 protein [Planctomycetaceae bacterium SH139]